MSYTKPEVVNLSGALKAIQGVDKQSSNRDNAIPHPLTATVNAYEADE